MLTFIGFLILGTGIMVLVISRIDIQIASLAWMKRLKAAQGVFLMVIGTFMMLLNSLFFFADRGFNYLLVYPTGKMSAVMEQGIKWRGFAKIDKWQKFIDVKVVGHRDLHVVILEKYVVVATRFAGRTLDWREVGIADQVLEDGREVGIGCIQRGDRS